MLWWIECAAMTRNGLSCGLAIRNSWLIFLKLLPPTIVLARIDRFAIVVQIILIVGEAAVAFVIGIVRVGIVGIVADAVFADACTRRHSDIEVADLAFDRQPKLP